MTATGHSEDLTALADPLLDTLLERLESDERAVSRRRSGLQDRIDFLRAGGFASAEPDRDDLELLLATEHELSERRFALHQQIDEVRAECSRRRAAR